MNPELLPTKRNLLTAKRNLVLANHGHDLLDKKQKVLMRELISIKNSASQLRVQLDNALKKAIMLGDKRLKKISGKIPLDTSLKITYRNVMGALIPKIEGKLKDYVSPPYALGESTCSIDEAFFAWVDVKFLIQKLAEAETSTRNIKSQLQKARRRAAALKNITIPAYEARIKYISEQLEECERDELARVKIARENIL